jgi:uroporphyrinogen-III decarboxylase
MTKKENLLRAIKREKPEWVPYGMEEAVVTIASPVVERPGKAGKDAFGVLWDYEETAEGGTYPHNGAYVVTDIENWREQVTFPDLDAVNWEEAGQKAASIDRGEFLVQGFVEMGIFERTYLLLGMEEALISYYSNPDEMYELCGAIADYKIALCKQFYDAVQPDMIWYGDDWGTQTDLFISPDHWRRIIKPHTKRIYDCLKERGVLVNQHSCGKIESVFGDLCDMGADVWNPCQPCNNLKDLKARYGDRICFNGGVDSQFILANPLKTPDDVREEVRLRIQEMALPGGGYITAPSHSVPYDKAKLAAMEEAARTYGREIYKPAESL